MNSSLLSKAENFLCYICFAIIVSFPVFQILSRFIGFFSIPASQEIVQHMTLWIAFIGAVLAARSNRLLAIVREPIFNKSSEFRISHFLVHMCSAGVVFVLAISYLKMIQIGIEYPEFIAPFITVWFAQSIIPVGLLLIWYHMIMTSSSRLNYRLLLVLGSFFIAIILYYWQFPFSNEMLLIMKVLGVIGLVAFGLPIFIVLAALSILFFLSEPTEWATNFDLMSTISDSAYRIVVSPTLAAIPIFTLAGYILAESNISKRLLNFFKASLGWLPGSTVLIVVLLCAFFTALTGGSGVTILALGAILYPILIEDGYSEIFSLGLITTAGSLGLLFPPSLPAIIYSVTAGINPIELFKSGLIPGLFLLFIIVCYGIYHKPKRQKKVQFNIEDLRKSFLDAKWEVVIPILIIYGLFSGLATLVECAALLVWYVLFVEVYIYRDIQFKDIPKIIIDCATLVGGVLIILGFAMGFTGYLVDAQIPLKILQFAKTSIDSPIMFLLALNILLLIAGCIMDIFSAIIVIVPLIAPLAIYFGIDPIHLGIIFIANLELGYITPPVGMNLFLSSYRFKKDMPTIYAATMPYFFIRLIGVLIITYIPLFFY
ncbi:MAG: TRAP transporter large permease subunit [Candidatus Marinimicrobia bacterium]|jgi:tripartite ATP-independent transporter DctM subunit|nr:TRAP transporter large permease subunit [Candidatus Neomarinimicrobiota bacterium]MBT3944088.1 TRAP transporter large permease subunit [Candidatus Neomarinimicrobiota bacterium]MBT4925959.1 TRAP transporter large permease subunit [Candidatus Neomarinimicrobiota bacterium]MBT5490266.1 TRAP transporter large permease subunit [Candidatus Neomarinimicrobiota bacterium]MBT6839696.1 TRAP transporter large permease subunit [Candidatus Neomarinimicrobiota bacterium]